MVSSALSCHCLSIECTQFMSFFYRWITDADYDELVYTIVHENEEQPTPIFPQRKPPIKTFKFTVPTVKVKPFFCPVDKVVHSS